MTRRTLFRTKQIGTIVSDISGTLVHKALPAQSLKYLTKNGANDISLLIESGLGETELDRIKQIKLKTGIFDNQTLVNHVAEGIRARNFKPDFLYIEGLGTLMGYSRGEINPVFYEDVLTMLKIWKSIGIPVHTFSFGSIIEQESILNSHKSQFSLAKLVEKRFDTDNAGDKYDPRSYESIQRQIGVKPGKIVYLSDCQKELDAAKIAGWNPVLVDRERLGELKSAKYPTISSFEEVGGDNIKRFKNHGHVRRNYL